MVTVVTEMRRLLLLRFCFLLVCKYYVFCFSLVSVLYENKGQQSCRFCLVSEALLLFQCQKLIKEMAEFLNIIQYGVGTRANKTLATIILYKHT